MIKLLLTSLSVLSLIPNFIDKAVDEPPLYNYIESFDPALSNINTTEKLEAFADKTAIARHILVGSADYFIILENILSRRFYHGFSTYTLSENWIAAAGQHFFGYGIATKVQPEDIMQHPYAGCSQQSAVMMAIAKRKGIPYRYTGFPHHYAVNINDHGKWYFFDSDMEPAIEKEQRLNTNWKEQNDSLKKYYSAVLQPEITYEFGNHTKAVFGPVNENPAARLKFFQGFTMALSKLLWLLPAILLAMRFSKKTVKEPVQVLSYNPLTGFPELLPA